MNNNDGQPIINDANGTLKRGNKRVLKDRLRLHDSTLRHANVSISNFAVRHRIGNAPTVTMNLDDFYKSSSAAAALANSDWAFILKMPKDEITQMLNDSK